MAVFAVKKVCSRQQSPQIRIKACSPSDHTPAEICYFGILHFLIFRLLSRARLSQFGSLAALPSFAYALFERNLLWPNYHMKGDARGKFIECNRWSVFFGDSKFPDGKLFGQFRKKSLVNSPSAMWKLNFMYSSWTPSKGRKATQKDAVNYEINISGD